MLQSRTAKFGKIIAFNPDNNTLKLDFEENPLGQPIWGKIGRLFHISDIHMAIDNQLDCRIEFLSDDLLLPILTNIYFSILAEDELRIRTKSIVIEGKNSLTLRSGSISTCYQAKNGSVTTSATRITSQAERLNIIRGEKIHLN